MFVLTSDKTTLINLEKVMSIQADITGEVLILCKDRGYQIIGEYASLERAKEIIGYLKIYIKAGHSMIEMPEK